MLSFDSLSCLTVFNIVYVEVCEVKRNICILINVQSRILVKLAYMTVELFHISIATLCMSVTITTITLRLSTRCYYISGSYNNNAQNAFYYNATCIKCVIEVFSVFLLSPLVVRGIKQADCFRSYLF